MQSLQANSPFDVTETKGLNLSSARGSGVSDFREKKHVVSASLSFNGGFVGTAGFLGLQGLFTAHVTGIWLRSALRCGTHGVIAGGSSWVRRSPGVGTYGWKCIEKRRDRGSMRSGRLVDWRGLFHSQQSRCFTAR
jgi:hypothetical protein